MTSEIQHFKSWKKRYQKPAQKREDNTLSEKFTSTSGYPYVLSLFFSQHFSNNLHVLMIVDMATVIENTRSMPSTIQSLDTYQDSSIYFNMSK